MEDPEISSDVSTNTADRRIFNIPPERIVAMRSAPSEGNLVSITNRSFLGQVLKADTITFSSDSRLSFIGNQDWMALVARRIMIAAPDEKFLIRNHNGDMSRPQTPPTPPKMPKAQAGINGEPNYDGGNGYNGANGTNAAIQGANGRPGRNRMQMLMIIANEIVRQDGTVPPNFTRVTIDTRGGHGGNGGNGGDGQEGGDGGSGGAGIAGFFGCTHMAGGGGRGGRGGDGGHNGYGGNGGTGGYVVLGGSQQAMDLFSFAVIQTDGGEGGGPGYPGNGGAGGSGGPRGPRPSNCDGGPPGERGANGQSPERWADDVPNGEKGLILYAPLDATTLFGS
jgi:hypothetical protein